MVRGLRLEALICFDHSSRLGVAPAFGGFTMFRGAVWQHTLDAGDGARSVESVQDHTTASASERMPRHIVLRCQLMVNVAKAVGEEFPAAGRSPHGIQTGCGLFQSQVRWRKCPARRIKAKHASRKSRTGSRSSSRTRQLGENRSGGRLQLG